MKRSASAKKATEKDGANKGSATPTRQPPPVPRKRPCAGKQVEEEERHVWLDSDAASINCHICFMPFDGHVFMCINGHAACGDCCVSLKRKCSCCGKSIGDVRCRPAENILAEMNTLCKFSNSGCGEVIKFVERRKHEEACRHAPCGCPVDGCSYRGMSTGLYEHVLDEHSGDVSFVDYLQPAAVTVQKSAPFCLLVQADMRKLFLLLNGGDVPALAGRSLHLVCLGPRPQGNVDIKYKMEVHGSDGGELSLLGTAPCIRELEAFEAKKFLFVPDAYWGPSASVSVRVRIG